MSKTQESRGRAWKQQARVEKAIHCNKVMDFLSLSLSSISRKEKRTTHTRSIFFVRGDRDQQQTNSLSRSIQLYYNQPTVQ